MPNLPMFKVWPNICRRSPNSLDFFLSTFQQNSMKGFCRKCLTACDHWKFFMLVEEDSFSKVHRNVNHQRRGAKITATVRPTLERSTYIMKYINFLDGSGIKKDPLLNPFLWDYKTRPKALNKRLEGWLKIFNFFWKKVDFCLFGNQKRVLWRAFLCFPSGRVVATENIDGYISW